MMGRYGDFGYGFGHMLGYGGFGLGFIITIIIWALLIWGIIAFVRGGQCWDGRCGYKDKKDDSAMKILKDRYAKGELSKEEYEKMKKDLTE